MGPLKQKLEANQPVSIFSLGDSTDYSAFGPDQLFVQALAQKYSGTARIRLWGEWNAGTGLPTGPKSYNVAVDTVYGAGPLITLWLCALPGSMASFAWDTSRKAAALDGVSTPDLIRLHQGHNFASFNVTATVNPTGDNLPTGRGLLLAAIGMLSLQWPDVPQIMTTQNPNRADTNMNNMYGAYLGVKSVMPTLGFVDTYKDFIALGKATRLFRPAGSDPTGVHPSDSSGAGNFDGGALQANRLMGAYNLSTPGAYSTTSWPAQSGTNLLTNGDFSDWTGTFPRNVTAFNSQTAIKDAAVKYGAAPYSMQMPCVSQFGSLRYSFDAVEKAALINKLVSVWVLFRTTAAGAGGAIPFYSVLIVDNLAQASPGPIQWIQGSTQQPVADNWYLSVLPGIQIGSALGASASINLYPNFPTTPVSGSAWVQQIKVSEGPLPSGPLP
jgi:hypothetical protein